MLIKHIINEDPSAGATSSGNIAAVSFPMTPGTTKAQVSAAMAKAADSTSSRALKWSAIIC